MALRVGDWKYIPANMRGRATGTGGANPSEARFTPNQIPSPLLFNLREDPAEERNVYEQFPERGQEMHRRLEALRQPSAGASQVLARLMVSEHPLGDALWASGRWAKNQKIWRPNEGSAICRHRNQIPVCPSRTSPGLPGSLVKWCPHGESNS
eukprot:gene17690-21637_t